MPQQPSDSRPGKFTNSATNSLTSKSDVEIIAYLFTGMLFFGGVIAAIPHWWTDMLNAGVRRHILVSGPGHPLLRLPRSHGIGLDLGRTVIVVAAVLLVLAILVATVRHQLRSRRDSNGAI